MKKRILAVLVAAVLLFTAVVPVSAASVTDFKDVSPEAWYYKAVAYAAENSLFSGTSADTFSPETPMTRGMFVTVLGRKNGIDKTKYQGSRFSDVKVGEYYAPYVEWAASNKMVSGTSTTEFSPNENVTREQMAAILYRYAKATQNDVTFTTDAYSKFPDTGKVSSWAREAFQWASTKGIIKGSNGKLDPARMATRAQVAQVFLGARDVLVKTEIVFDPTIAPTPDPVPTPSPDIDETVYWVKGGSVYHSTDQCPALARSTNIQSGTLEEAIAAGKTRPCKDCH